MRQVYIATLFLCFATLNSYAIEQESSSSIETAPQRNLTEQQVEVLKKKEALLQAILDNSEFIQFRDGSLIDLDNLDLSEGLNQLQSGSITNSIRAIEGGTGGGG